MDKTSLEKFNIISKLDSNPRLSQPRLFGKKLTRKALLIIIWHEILVGVILFILLIHSVSLNATDKIKYADEASEDQISCSDGALIVNDVTVLVPTDGNVKYNIAYSWGKDDRKYPTIPRSITASYRDDSDNILYDLTLYKDSFTPADKLKPGQNVSTWFRSWITGDDGKVKREQKDVGNIHGFLISTTGSSDEGEGSIYESSTYYFAVHTPDGITVYILEGNLYDRDSQKAMQAAMKSAMESISIKEQAA